MSSPEETKPVIGLFGAIGAGKSTIAAYLATRGGCVVDADKLGHSALENPGVKAALVDRWGERVLKPDGTVNRRVVGGLVFADPCERKYLEGLVFPVIGALMGERIAEAKRDPAGRFVVLDAAVMLEAGWAGACDRILYVDAPRDVRLARLAARSGWSAAEVAAREAAQWPAEKKMSRADAVIINDGKSAEVFQSVDAVLTKWQIGL